MKIAYVRVSTDGQSTGRQLDNIPADRVFSDAISGVTDTRPGLDAMIAQLRPGDEVLVHSLDRLARSMSSLKTITERITATGATLSFLKERLTFTKGDDAPVNSLMFHILGSFAQFERDMIRSRSREGIARAKAAGKYKGGKPKLTDAQARTVYDLVTAGLPITAAAEAFKVSRPTIYKALEAHGYITHTTRHTRPPTRRTK